MTDVPHDDACPGTVSADEDTLRPQPSPIGGLAASGGVFINYRGQDSRSYGALLYTELRRNFGGDLVFLDSESIPAGADFAEYILGRVRRCGVLLAVIGPRWLTAAEDEYGATCED